MKIKVEEEGPPYGLRFQAADLEQLQRALSAPGGKVRKADPKELPEISRFV